METFKQFEKHLKSVCKDKELREIAIQYYHDLGKHMEGVTYTKDDFETITYNGKVVEQDVVKDLFSKQESATAQEVFTNLFKTNVKYFAAEGNEKFESEGSEGFFDSNENKICIRDHSALEFYKIFQTDTVREYEKSDKKLMQFAEDVRALRLKGAIYHELSHVFELKSFMGGKVDQTGMKQSYGVKISKKKHVLIPEANISNRAIKERLKEDGQYKKDVKNKVLPDLNRFIGTVRNVGVTAIAETINEVFAKKVRGAEKTQQQIVAYSNFTNKKALIGTCAYNKDYNMLNYFRVSVGEEDLEKNRFNSQKLTEDFKNLNISEERLEELKQSTKSILIKNGIDAATLNFYYKIDKLDSKDFMFFTLGYGKLYKDYEQECKCIVQSALMENYKNNITQQLNDPTVQKDKDFFEKLNKDLTTLDDYTMYPLGYTDFKQESYKPTLLETKRVNNAEIYSVHEYAKHATEGTPYKAFAEIIDAVKESVEQNKENIPDLEESMTFLKSQQELQQKYEGLLEKQFNAIVAYKEAINKQNEKQKDLEFGDDWF